MSASSTSDAAENDECSTVMCWYVVKRKLCCTLLQQPLACAKLFRQGDCLFKVKINIFFPTPPSSLSLSRYVSSAKRLLWDQCRHCCLLRYSQPTLTIHSRGPCDTVIPAQWQGGKMGHLFIWIV